MSLPKVGSIAQIRTNLTPSDLAFYKLQGYNDDDVKGLAGCLGIVVSADRVDGIRLFFGISQYTNGIYWRRGMLTFLTPAEETTMNARFISELRDLFEEWCLTNPTNSVDAERSVDAETAQFINDVKTTIDQIRSQIDALVKKIDVFEHK